MPVETILALAAVTVAACALHAAIGFGSGPLLVPVLLLVVDRPAAVVGAVLLGMTTNALQLAAEGRRPAVAVRELRPLWLAAPAGAVLGALVAGDLSRDALGFVVAGTLIVCAVVGLAAPRSLPRGALVVGGAAAGCSAAVTGVFGPLLGALLLGSGLRGGALRDAIGLSFLVVGACAVAATLAVSPGWDGLLLAAGLAGPAALGHALGRRGFGRLSARAHRLAVVIAVVVGAGVAVLPALG